MPFTRIALPAATPPEQRAAIARAVHDAMVATIGIPADDFFQLLSAYAPGDFQFDRGFLGQQRSERMVVLQITLRRGRSDAMKRDLYARIAAHLNQAAISGRRMSSSTSRRTTSPTGRSAAAE